ncbi:hypothetical protein QFZ75_004264 [Streptomyces sp. V3I8]|nr:hypothetical protein [Streptomyces sp. V3I8]
MSTPVPVLGRRSPSSGDRARGVRVPGSSRKVRTDRDAANRPAETYEASAGLVLAEPLDAGAQQVVEEPGDDERRRSEGHGDESRTQGQAPQGVHVVRQRPYRRALQRGRGQQRGCRALAAHRPEALGDPGHEGRHQEHGQRVLGGPVDPQGRDDQQHGPYAVRADHGPAAVERTVLGGQGGERAEEHRSEEQRREDARPEDRRDGERHSAVAAAEGAVGHRRLQGEEDQDEQRQGVADASHELCAPQAPQLRYPEQRPDGALP